MLRFQYKYTNDVRPELEFNVKAEGNSRQELADILIKKENTVALYYFHKYFPDLTGDLKLKVEREIMRIANVTDIENIKFPKCEYNLSFQSVSISAEGIYSIISF